MPQSILNPARSRRLSPVFAVTFLAASFLACSSDRPRSDESAIVGGKESAADAHPWLAAIFFGDEQARYQGCGGSLIDATHVLTAAHCSVRSAALTDLHQLETTSEDPAQVWVVLRPQSIAGVRPEEFVAVKRIFVHPKYRDDSTDNDYAIYELARPVTLPSYPELASEESVDALLASGAPAVAAGYGTTSMSGETADRLNEVELPLFTDAACRAAYAEGSGGATAISENMLCAGYPEGGKDTCQGDSGGPLFVSQDGAERLVGVVSWGRGCALAGYPGVYSKIARARSWIEQCRAGTCESLAPVRSCATYYADCDGQAANGCEVDLASPSACSQACGGTGCAAGETCGVTSDGSGVRCTAPKAIRPRTYCAFPAPSGSGKAAVSFGYENDSELIVRASAPASVFTNTEQTYPVGWFRPGAWVNAPTAIQSQNVFASWTLTDPTGATATTSVDATTTVCPADPRGEGPTPAPVARMRTPVEPREELPDWLWRLRAR